jgi:murein DD-endopeptidase MepM/ murein hydrolase activator NlpD
MYRVRSLIKKAFTPITIMMIPHSDARSIRFKIPSIGIVVSAVLLVLGMIFVFSIAVDALRYNETREELAYYSGQFSEVRSTISTLKKTEEEFRKLFSLKSKEEVLENLDTSDSGSLDLESLKEQIKATMESTAEIKDYLSEKRDVYLSTPRGWPVDGHITSPFGWRTHPMTGAAEFHGGLDIAAEPGLPVRATADGIVSDRAWAWLFHFLRAQQACGGQDGKGRQERRCNRICRIDRQFDRTSCAL